MYFKLLNEIFSFWRTSAIMCMRGASDRSPLDEVHPCYRGDNVLPVYSGAVFRYRLEFRCTPE
jgi:hypothetical protein